MHPRKNKTNTKNNKKQAPYKKVFLVVALLVILVNPAAAASDFTGIKVPTQEEMAAAQVKGFAQKTKASFDVLASAQGLFNFTKTKTSILIADIKDGATDAFGAFRSLPRTISSMGETVWGEHVLPIGRTLENSSARLVRGMGKKARSAGGRIVFYVGKAGDGLSRGAQRAKWEAQRAKRDLSSVPSFVAEATKKGVQGAKDGVGGAGHSFIAKSVKISRGMGDSLVGIKEFGLKVGQSVQNFASDFVYSTKNLGKNLIRITRVAAQGVSHTFSSLPRAFSHVSRTFLSLPGTFVSMGEKALSGVSQNVRGIGQKVRDMGEKARPVKSVVAVLKEQFNKVNPIKSAATAFKRSAVMLADFGQNFGRGAEAMGGGVGKISGNLGDKFAALSRGFAASPVAMAEGVKSAVFTVGRGADNFGRETVDFGKGIVAGPVVMGKGAQEVALHISRLVNNFGDEMAAWSHHAASGPVAMIKGAETMSSKVIHPVGSIIGSIASNGADAFGAFRSLPSTFSSMGKEVWNNTSEIVLGMGKKARDASVVVFYGAKDLNEKLGTLRGTIPSPAIVFDKLQVALGKMQSAGKNAEKSLASLKSKIIFGTFEKAVKRLPGELFNGLSYAARGTKDGAKRAVSFVQAVAVKTGNDFIKMSRLASRVPGAAVKQSKQIIILAKDTIQNSVHPVKSAKSGALWAFNGVKSTGQFFVGLKTKASIATADIFSGKNRVQSDKHGETGAAFSVKKSKNPMLLALADTAKEVPQNLGAGVGAITSGMTAVLDNFSKTVSGLGDSVLDLPSAIKKVPAAIQNKTKNFTQSVKNLGKSVHPVKSAVAVLKEQFNKVNPVKSAKSGALWAFNRVKIKTKVFGQDSAVSLKELFVESPQAVGNASWEGALFFGESMKDLVEEVQLALQGRRVEIVQAPQTSNNPPPSSEGETQRGSSEITPPATPSQVVIREVVKEKFVPSSAESLSSLKPKTYNLQPIFGLTTMDGNLVVNGNTTLKGNEVKIVAPLLLENNFTIASVFAIDAATGNLVSAGDMTASGKLSAKDLTAKGTIDFAGATLDFTGAKITGLATSGGTIVNNYHYSSSGGGGGSIGGQFDSLNIRGDATIQGLAVTGGAAFNSSVTLGDASSDTVTINSAAISIPNGITFSNGAVTFGGSTTTSTFAGNIAINGAGTSTLLYGATVATTGGSFGVGTSSPTNAQFAVSGNSYLQGNLGVGTSSPVAKFGVTGDAYISGNTTIGNSTTLFVDTANNRVGISTSSPLSKLHITGTADTRQIIVQANSTQNVNVFEYQNAAGSAPLVWISPTGSFGASGTIYAGGFSTSTLDAVIIGGSSPAAAYFTRSSSTLSSVYQGLFVGTTATTSIYGNTTSTFANGLTTLGQLSSTGAGTSTISYGLTLATNGGNVGIGTASPGYLLDVNGTMRSSGLFYPSGGISTSTLDNVIIGQSTNALGRFTTLVASTTLAVGISGTTDATSTVYHGLELGNRTGYNRGVFNIDTLGNVNASGTLRLANILYPLGGISTSTIDQTVIGGSTPAAGSFTTLSANLFTGSLATSTWYGNIATSTFVDITSTGLATLNKASSTLSSVYQGLFVGTTATTSIYGQTTSTFGAGVQATYLNLTGAATATSTINNLQASHLYTTNGLTVVGGLILPASAVTDAMLSDAITISGGTIGSNNISGTLTTTASLTIGDNGDNIIIDSNVWDVSAAGVATFAGLSTSTLDGMLIGGSTPATSTFTGLTVNETATFNGIITLGNGDDIAINSNDWDISSAGVTSNLSITTSTLDSVIIGQASPSSAYFTRSSSTLSSIYQGLFVGTTATSSIYGHTTSTFANGLTTLGQLSSTGSGTSTISYGLTLATSGGNVGIGTVSPGYLLDVNGTFRAAGVIYPDRGISTSTLDGMLIGGSTPATSTFTGLTVNETATFNGIITLGNGDDIAINSNDWDITSAGVTSNLSITTSTLDSVIIGQASPSSAYFTRSSSTLSSVYQGLFVGTTATTSIYGNTTSTFANGLTTLGQLSSTGSGTSTISYGLTLATSGGNVGIGTVSPGYLLDVNGTFRAAGVIYPDRGISTSTLDNITLGVVTPTRVSSTLLSVMNTLYIGGANTSTLTTGNRGSATSTFYSDLSIINRDAIFGGAANSGWIWTGDGTATTSIRGGTAGSTTSTFEGDVSIANLYVGSSEFAGDSGIVGAFSMPVSASAATGTEEGYTFAVDNLDVMRIVGTSDAQGSVWDLRMELTDNKGTATTTIRGTTGTTSTFAGNVQVNGEFAVSGNCTENGGACADIAEQYTSVDEVEAGDVVVSANAKTTLSGAEGSPYNSSLVEKSKSSFASNVVGVVSTNPGLTLGYGGVRIGSGGAGGTNKPNIALAGRVPVKVTNENGIIKKGDYLVTSEALPGYAMKYSATGTAPQLVNIFAMALDDWDPATEITEENYKKNKITVLIKNVLIQNNNFGADLTISEKGADIIADGEYFDFSGKALINIKSLSSVSGSWSLSEAGEFVAKSVNAKVVTLNELIVLGDKETDASGAVLDPAVGNSFIPSDEHIKVVYNNRVKKNSQVFITFRDNTGGPWWVSGQGDGFFEVSVPASMGYNIRFSYWIVSVEGGPASVIPAEAGIQTDSSPPEITAVAAVNITDAGATINWATSEDADSVVEVRVPTSYSSPSSSPEVGTPIVLSASALSSSHSLNLTNLTPQAIYYYIVKSTDAAGNIATSQEYSFTTASLASEVGGDLTSYSSPPVPEVGSPIVPASGDSAPSASSTPIIVPASSDTASSTPTPVASGTSGGPEPVEGQSSSTPSET